MLRLCAMCHMQDTNTFLWIVPSVHVPDSLKTCVPMNNFRINRLMFIR